MTLTSLLAWLFPLYPPDWDQVENALIERAYTGALWPSCVRENTK